MPKRFMTLVLLAFVSLSVSVQAATNSFAQATLESSTVKLPKIILPKLHNPLLCERVLNLTGALKKQRYPLHSIVGSEALNTACLGPRATHRSASPAQTFNPLAQALGPNVDAAGPQEDITSAGVQAYGQAGPSVAAIDNNVLEAWTDATGFYTPCPSSSYKEELIGIGFSNNGGRSFKDEGGLPNSSCVGGSGGFRYLGDPFAEAYQAAPGGAARDYFYVGGVYEYNAANLGQIAMDVCKVAGVFLSCNSAPITIAGGFGFLDKPYATIDPAKKRLYVSYTRYVGSGYGQIELAQCDLSNPDAPACTPGAVPTPYYVVAATDVAGGCEQTGSYPAVDRVTGDVYVAWEYNFGTNANTSSPCSTTPTTNNVAQVPYLQCLSSGLPISPCAPASLAGPALLAKVPIVSMDVAQIPGYTGTANDFPRIAVSDPQGTVSIVWNDARYRPTGDVLLESFLLGTGFPQEIQTKGNPIGAAPVRLSNNRTATYDYMPAQRYSEPDGNLDITWTDRRRCNIIINPSLTDVYGVFEVNPRTKSSTPPYNRLITSKPSSWIGSSSNLASPNYGSYTDNYVKQSGSSASGYLAGEDFIAWSDARLGEPQPFEAYLTGI